jgi:hypothetical protein
MILCINNYEECIDYASNQYRKAAATGISSRKYCEESNEKVFLLLEYDRVFVVSSTGRAMSF